MSKTVLVIIEDYLKANGYDGLFNRDFECACEPGDLAPCGDPQRSCEAGVKRPCDCGEHDFHITPKEEQA